MQFQEFKDSLQQEQPSTGISIALQALWYAGREQWDAAHDVTQTAEGVPDVDWVHAHLHRQEGDLPNAGYWYRRANRSMPASTVSIEAEWAEMVTTLLIVEK